MKEKMNKFIQKQLENINIDIPYFDDNTTHLIISHQKSNKKYSNEFIIGDTCNIRVQKYVLDPSYNYSLYKNWNCETVPPEEDLIAKVIQINGNMIKFICTGKITKEQWEGWLTKDSIQIVLE